MFNSPENRRKSRMSALDQESVQFVNANFQYDDPLGISQVGNLPEISEALKETGTVCVERTLRILNRSKGNNLFT